MKFLFSVMWAQTTEKKEGLKALEEAIEAVTSKIESYGGKLEIQMAPKVRQTILIVINSTIFCSFRLLLMLKKLIWLDNSKRLKKKIAKSLVMMTKRRKKTKEWVLLTMKMTKKKHRKRKTSFVSI